MDLFWWYFLSKKAQFLVAAANTIFLKITSIFQPTFKYLYNYLWYMTIHAIKFTNPFKKTIYIKVIWSSWKSLKCDILMGNFFVRALAGLRGISKSNTNKLKAGFFKRSSFSGVYKRKYHWKTRWWWWKFHQSYLGR